MAKRYLRLPKWDRLACHADSVRISFSAEPRRQGELALVHHMNIPLTQLLEPESLFHERMHEGAKQFFAQVDVALRASQESNDG